jgi:DNA-binding transcriptional ArsR family regulator
MAAEDAQIASLRAMAHPVRVRMLSLLTRNPMSATDVADELQIAHATASYHLRQLADAGLVRVVDMPRDIGQVGRTPVRYETIIDAHERLDRTDPGDTAFQALLADLERRHRTIERHRFIADAELWLEPEVWEEIVRLSERIFELAHGSALPPRAPAAIHASVTTAAFELRGARR